ncbi:MAG: LysM peptidoglycan-binding domain-containing protein [Verrucomicrobiota bacterium JB023]|nr:LysM peptidoglycan-binding domain-containing protein [Verrucomicrobiota bacterium JB023]
MKHWHWFLLPCALLLVACSDTGGSKSADIYHPDFGPFDENGDYIESLADAPVKKNHFSRKKAPEPKRKIEKKIEPKRVIVKKEKKKETPKPVVLARTTSEPARRTITITQPASTRATQTTYRASTSSSSRTTSAASKPTTVVSKPASQPKPSPATRSTSQPTSKPKPTPKPKAVVVKPKAKAPIRHRVTSSDTLYSLSRKYSTSVSAIQKANGLSGTTIITGSTILIPR